MCGGVAGLCHQSQGRVGLSKYHVGRGLSYLFLGALAGLGSSIIISRLPDLIIILSCLLIVYGVLGILNLKTNFFTKKIFSIFSPAIRIARRTGPFSLGLATGFIPCGWLYSFVALSGTQGSVLNGMLVMGCFWVGTVLWLSVPLWFLTTLRKYIPVSTVLYCLIIVSGILMLVKHVEKLSVPKGVAQQLICHPKQET